jgi:hypothetical protein
VDENEEARKAFRASLSYLGIAFTDLCFKELAFNTIVTIYNNVALDRELEPPTHRSEPGAGNYS